MLRINRPLPAAPPKYLEGKEEGGSRALLAFGLLAQLAAQFKHAPHTY